MIATQEKSVAAMSEAKEQFGEKVGLAHLIFVGQTNAKVKGIDKSFYKNLLKKHQGNESPLR
jgi:hypothetical protein